MPRRAFPDRLGYVHVPHRVGQLAYPAATAAAVPAEQCRAMGSWRAADEGTYAATYARLKDGDHEPRHRHDRISRSGCGGSSGPVAARLAGDRPVLRISTMSSAARSTTVAASVSSAKDGMICRHALF